MALAWAVADSWADAAGRWDLSLGGRSPNVQFSAAFDGLSLTFLTLWWALRNPIAVQVAQWLKLIGLIERF
ncbi:MAG: hypothetical protein KME20_03075 [Kaiparowitsia implicata GSE-PSE-MK54-09C]|jgi:hypothetical protein|nr:hypothetical protein [Kaiparowitsia implicata GSE-PSE-MK54-09C]